MIEVKTGSTDQTLYVYAVDEVSGLPKTGLTFSQITARYVRVRGAPVAIVAASLASVDAPHTDGGFIQVDGTYCKGWYRFDVPDAPWGAGSEFVWVCLQASGALVTPVAIHLFDATPGEMYDEVHLCKAMLANKRLHTVSTGVDVIRDDDGTTTLRTMTPSFDGDDTITVTPS